MGNNLNELASYFEPLAQKLLDSCSSVGILCCIIDTGRTAEKQVVKLEAGVSWTTKSKHEPQPPEGKSEAIDICPVVILNGPMKNWDPKNPLWLRIGLIGESLGLKWGGRWDLHPDMSHFEYIHPLIKA